MRSANLYLRAHARSRPYRGPAPGEARLWDEVWGGGARSRLWADLRVVSQELAGRRGSLPRRALSSLRLPLRYGLGGRLRICTFPGAFGGSTGKLLGGNPGGGINCNVWGETPRGKGRESRGGCMGNWNTRLSPSSQPPMPPLPHDLSPGAPSLAQAAGA